MMTTIDNAQGNTDSESSWAQSPKGRTTLWFLTINNFSSADVELFKNEETIYICFQSECGEQDHVHHVHAILRYKNARSFKSIKAKWPRAHIEGVKNFDKCRIYTLKERTFTGLRYERVFGTVKTDEDNRPDDIDFPESKPIDDFEWFRVYIDKNNDIYPAHMVESWDYVPSADDWNSHRT